MVATFCQAQDSTPFVLKVPDTVNRNLSIDKKRQLLMGATHFTVYGGWLVMLNATWYKNYPRSKFHSFNDMGEWQQMDKVGHAWTVYTSSRISYGMWRWTGISNIKSVLLSATPALAYMLAVEYLDGRSAEWGWSWGDAGANAFGAALFASQQLAWNEQKVQLKFSAHPARYPPDTRQRADELFGTGFLERTLKDYNTQAYWLSFHLPKGLKLPPWLQISFGYGAAGMLGGYENTARDKDGNVTFNRPDIKRYRQWYVAPDIDLTRIKTKSKLLKTVFYTLNSLKFPAPTLEFSNGKFKGHFLYF
ncbi:MAG: hypothetical protein JWP69_1053 [Flaviaesturariibacter sp.]|nr:hypothetical protein [Flaviaesturariibacter sp.]